MDTSAHTIALSELAETLSRNGILAGPTPQAAEDTLVSGSACDSRLVEPGNIFVCKGAAFRPEFLARARDAGAVAYLCDTHRAGELARAVPELPALVTADVRQAMALVAAAATGHPDRDLPIVGITGTKGKTTCAYMLRSVIEHARGARSCGIMGTVETYDGVEDLDSHNTTPESPDLWRHLAHARDTHLSAMVMEVSSQALKYERTLGVGLRIGCFLNIGMDHISPVEHRDFEDYFSSKLKIFAQCQVAVANLDSDHADRILAAAREAPRALTFGIERPEADAWASGLAFSEEGTSFDLHLPGEAPRTLAIPFPGAFSVSDALCAALCAHLLGIGADDICAGLSATHVPGRMEFFRTRDRRVTAIVDYAHNRLSFESLFSAVRGVFEGARVIALFGAVGGKAQERRRDLPEVAARVADHIILTADDPWTEDPADIAHQMEAALPKGFSHEVIVDREAAVRQAFSLAEADKDHRYVILLLAKGSDATQHVADGYAPYASDSALAAELVAAHDVRAAGAQKS